MRETSLKTGLTWDEVERRRNDGQINFQDEPRTKSVREIVLSNIFTVFNLLNFGMALLVAFTGEWRNLLFIFVAIFNTLIRIIEELRAKSHIDQLSLIISSSTTVLRDGERENVRIDELVLDDIIYLEQGDQVPSDSLVREGLMEANESLLTGESSSIRKEKGDELLSGSYVVSGGGTAQVVRVGASNLSSKITAGAKMSKPPNSVLLKSLDKIITTVGIFIVPLGLLTFMIQFMVVGEPVKEAVLSAVTSVIGMIPNGLVLLTSSALAVGTVRLAKSKTLVQELYCIETLARVDTLCVDKTGTLTEGRIMVTGCAPVNGYDMRDVEVMIPQLLGVTGDKNQTARALAEHFGRKQSLQYTGFCPFSSSRKYSMASFRGRGTYVLGAPDVLLKYSDTGAVEEAQQLALKGQRIVAVLRSDTLTNTEELPPGLEPVALITLSEKIREDAAETLAYFAKQGVAVKVISGDNPLTVSAIAGQVGLEGSERFADIQDASDEDLADLVREGTVIFGRSSPEQKKVIIQALKEEGHVTAMVGDGVNDVLALRESDCSIALASGSEASRNVSQLILLNSAFSSLPKVLNEGRRIINNIGRVAPLYLVKTISAFALALFYIIIRSSYPYMPIHYTIIGSLTVGIPSFFLAMQPNHDRVKGDFLTKVFGKAVPGAVALVATIMLLEVVQRITPLADVQLTTAAVWTYAMVGLMVLAKVSWPMDKFRIILFSVLSACMIGTLLLFYPHLYLTALRGKILVITICSMMLVIPIMRLTQRIQRRYRVFRRKARAAVKKKMAG